MSLKEISFLKFYFIYFFMITKYQKIATLKKEIAVRIKI